MSQLTDNLFVLAPRKEKGRAEPGEGVVNPRRTTTRVSSPSDRVHSVPDRGVLDEASFHRMISLEKKDGALTETILAHAFGYGQPSPVGK